MKITKKLTIKIAIILLFILIVDTTMPILSSQAGFLEAMVDWVAEKVFSAISNWLVNLGDLVIEALQDIFVSPDSIQTISRYVCY